MLHAPALAESDVVLGGEAGLPVKGAVASMERAPLRPVPGAIVLAVPGACLPFAAGVVLLLPGVGTTLSHSVLCTSTAWVVPEVHLSGARDAVPMDAVMSSVAVGTLLGPPV